MKVLFVKPRWPYPRGKSESTYNRVWPDLSQLYSAASVERDGGEAAVLDAHAERLGPAEVARRARGFDRVFLTSTPLDRWQCPNLELEPFVETARALVSAGHPPIVTGFHGTVDPESVLRRTGALAVVRGEPEGAVAELCRGPAVRDVAGVACLEDDCLAVAPERPLLDLARLPTPAYHLVDPSRYRYEILGPRFGLFELSRGCPYACSFCAKDVMYGAGVRRKPLERVRAELDEAVGRRGVRSGYFIDLEFSVNASRTAELCEFLIGRGWDFRWCCQLRPDRLDRGLLGLMRRAGCRLVHLGAESGSAERLRALDKPLAPEQVREAVATIREAGMESLCFFLLGLPGEDRAESDRTVDFAIEAAPTYASFHAAHAYGATALRAAAGSRPADAASRVRGAFVRFYLRPGYVGSRLAAGNPASLWRQARLFLSYLRWS